jgi:hypothetical protein
MALAFEHLDFELCLTFELWPLFVLWILTFGFVQASCQKSPVLATYFILLFGILMAKRHLASPFSGVSSSSTSTGSLKIASKWTFSKPALQ